MMKVNIFFIFCFYFNIIRLAIVSASGEIFEKLVGIFTYELYRQCRPATAVCQILTSNKWLWACEGIECISLLQHFGSMNAEVQKEQA